MSARANAPRSRSLRRCCSTLPAAANPSTTHHAAKRRWYATALAVPRGRLLRSGLPLRSILRKACAGSSIGAIITALRLSRDAAPQALLLDPKRQKHTMTRVIQISLPSTGEEEWQATREPLMSGWLTQGPKVAQFEKAFAARHSVTHALATTSCTTGLHLILAAMNIGPGDEVIIPAFTWV